FTDDTDSVDLGTSVFYSRSTDGGRTYSTPIRISRDGQSSATPIITTGSPGNVFIAWRYSKMGLVDGLPVLGGSQIAVARSSDSGATFSAPTDISANQTVIGSLVGLNQDLQGGLEVFYFGQTGDGPQAYRDLVMARSSDGGKTFADPVAISGAGQAPALASMVSDNSGAVLVIYCDESGLLKNSQTPIFACRARGGKTFAQPVQISPEAVFIPIFAPSLALGPDGSAYVLYESFTPVPDPNDSNVIDLKDPALSLLAAPDGKTFSLVAHLATNAFQASMLVGPTGRIFVAFVGLETLPSG